MAILETINLRRLHQVLQISPLPALITYDSFCQARIDSL